jgi:ribosomal protein S3
MLGVKVWIQKGMLYQKGKSTSNANSIKKIAL